MKFTYLKQPPKKYTFQAPLIKKFVEERCKGKVLNLFAGKVKLNVNEVRVDIDTNCPADYHMDAFEFVKMAIEKEWKFDTIILDPPYNYRKAREKYGGRYIGKFTKLKRLIPRILNLNGIVITFGFNSGGMQSPAFKKEEIALIYHGGDHNDTIIVVERFILKPIKDVVE